MAGEIITSGMDFSLDHTLAVLERTPTVLSSLLRDVGDDWTRGNYGPGTWCAYEVVGHLIIAEREDWIPRARIILEHGESRPFDPFPHDAAISPASGRALNDLLDEFASLRESSLRALRDMKLTEADLSRRGTHPALGPVTLAQLLATWTAHDLHHTRQVCTAMCNQYAEAVGPWRAYINTMR
jgi:uncharacterized damage-inducible protein DinB